MKQPDLGLKVAELRQQKGMTQEQLAETCEISARTIQRIESGEVDPRTYTIQRLSETLNFDFGKENVENEQAWLAALHLSSILPLVIFPLFVWSWKRAQSYKIDRQGRDVINFQITMALVLFLILLVVMLMPFFIIGVLVPLTGISPRIGLLELLILFGPLPLILVGVYTTLISVVNTVRALSGRSYKYLPSIRFIR